MRAPMAKLIRCTVGKILDVAVDLRMSSPTFGKAFTVELTAENKTQLFVPIGFAHGFAALSDICEVQYKQTEFYQPACESGIAWNDPDLDINWPFKDEFFFNFRYAATARLWAASVSENVWRDSTVRTKKRYLVVAG